MNASASSLFVYSPLATAGVLVASTTSAPTPVPAGVSALKPVPSWIFLPLRLSCFLFSFTVSSTLIDFKIKVSELISFAFLSTSCWVTVFKACKSLTSSINFSACSICDCCFSFARIRFTSDCNSLTFSCNSVVCTFVSTGTSTFAFFSATGASWDFGVSTTFVIGVETTSVFEVFSTVVGLEISLSTEVFCSVTTIVLGSVTSLASTWYPKKKPAPTNTLAAPTFNFLIEYFSNFCPFLCWRRNWLFFPTIIPPHKIYLFYT